MLQHWFTARIMNIFNKITGIILIAFSVYLIVSMIRYQTGSVDDTQNLKKTSIVQKVHNFMKGDSNSKTADTLEFPAVDSLIDSLNDSLAVTPVDSL